MLAAPLPCRLARTHGVVAIGKPDRKPDLRADGISHDGEARVLISQGAMLACCMLMANVPLPFVAFLPTFLNRALQSPSESPTFVPTGSPTVVS